MNSLKHTFKKHLFSNRRNSASTNTEDNFFVENIISLTGKKVSKMYIKKKILGVGGFSKCYIAQVSGTDREVAAKIISKRELVSNNSKSLVINEIKIHRTLKHQNVVSFIHYFQDIQNNESLNEAIKRGRKFTVPQIQELLLGICRGVKYIHSKKYIHRDLKLANILLSKDFQIKICDFGLASKVQFLHENKRTACGTPNYIAPQVLDGIGYYFEVDIWAIGIILYSLFYGIAPFQSSAIPQIYKKIRNGEYFFPENSAVPPQAVQLIRSILVQAPALRPSLDQIMSSCFIKLGKTIPRTLQQICDNDSHMSPYVLKCQQSKKDSTSFVWSLQSQQKFNLQQVEVQYSQYIDQSQQYANLGQQYTNIDQSQQYANISQPQQYVRQLQPINETSYFFQTNKNVIGIFTKNKQVVFKHLQCFQDNTIYQISLQNRLHAKPIRKSLQDYQHRAIINLKAKTTYLRLIFQQNILSRNKQGNQRSLQELQPSIQNIKFTNKNHSGFKPNMASYYPSLSILKAQTQLNILEQQKSEAQTHYNYIINIKEHKDTKIVSLSNRCIQIIFALSQDGFIYEYINNKLFLYWKTYYTQENKQQFRQVSIHKLLQVIENSGQNVCKEQNVNLEGSKLQSKQTFQKKSKTLNINSILKTPQLLNTKKNLKVQQIYKRISIQKLKYIYAILMKMKIKRISKNLSE